MRILLLIVCYLFCTSSTQAGGEENLIIFFWNVENLFHPENDSLTNDEEFTPVGARYWTFSRYYSKLNRIWKIIVAAGNPKPPDIIAMAEIENLRVLKDLMMYSPPGKYNYKIVHQESPDRRGIDVALLYDPTTLNLFLEEFITVDLEPSGGGPTRDILHAGFARGSDSLHIFVSHWPSKYGGVGYSDPFRMIAAQILSINVSRIIASFPEHKIICIGDFNDVTESESIKFFLNETPIRHVPFTDEFPQGSLKFQGKWETIDHIFVSDNLFEDQQKISAHFFAPEFLFERDDSYGGIRPFRSWEGYWFREGFSDHVPVVLEVK
ncbi:MAG: endonuclease [Bacteroidales bacterium]|nr:endonuclease [Bacteroidales bacterium]